MAASNAFVIIASGCLILNRMAIFAYSTSQAHANERY